MTDEAHEISVVVWDIPSPVVAERPFAVRIGVECSARCALGGHVISVSDDGGTLLARATLGDTPWEGTNALYWIEVELPGPVSDGRHTWQVTYEADAASGLTGPVGHEHPASSSTFSFAAAGQPDHAVTIVAIDVAAGAPMERVELRMGPYRATTDARGTATIGVPAGSYHLLGWKLDFEASPVAVTVAGDVTVEVEMRPVPRAEEPYWM